MFGRTHVHVTPEVHIHQKSANAVDAARLHREIRDKAEAEAMQAVVRKLGADNQITMMSWQSTYDCSTDERTLRASVSINGRVYEISASTEELLEAAAYTVVASQLLARMADIVCGNPGKYRL